MKQRSIILPLLFLAFFLRAPQAAQSKTLSAEEQKERLAKGEIFSEGGYLKKGVWGKMEGVVEAPPRVVWRLFLQANEWRRYGLPTLIDSRAVNQEIAEAAAATKSVDEFYRILDKRTFDPTAHQKSYSIWTNHAFQYYDVPWPVANRWMVLKNKNDERRSAENVFHTQWVSVAGNVDIVTGNLRLEPFDGDPYRTLMKYDVETSPGARVPKFLLKWGVKKTMPAAIEVIRKEAERVYGRPPPLLKTSQLLR